MKKFEIYLNQIGKWWEDENQLNIVKLFTRMKDDAFYKMKILISVLDEIYPDHWDIQLIPHSLVRYQLKVVIHFPEITVTNSMKESHTIYDMYFRFNIISEFYYSFDIDELQGVRTKISYGEKASSYSHSHLPATPHESLKYSGFCLGSSEIRVIMMLINQSDEVDINLYRYFLQQIKSYLSWESLEGGPHIRMRDVVARGLMNDLPIVNSDIIYDIHRKLESKSLFENLSIDFTSNGRAFIIDDEDYEIQLRKFMNVHIQNYKRYMCYKDASGNYYGTKNELENFKFAKNSIIFKGEEVFLTLDKELPDQEGELFLHPKIKNYITKTLEYDINKFQLKDRAFLAATR